MNNCQFNVEFYGDVVSTIERILPNDWGFHMENWEKSDRFVPE